MKNFFGFLTRVSLPQHSRATLYLDLQGNQLRAFHLPNTDWVNLPLPDRTIINGVLFKPAALARAITNYLTAHHLVSPQTLISFSPLEAAAKPMRLFTAFSLALALKRVPLLLAKVVVPPASATSAPTHLEAALAMFERLPDELAAFRPPAGRSSTGWLFTSVALIALGSLVGGIVHWRTYHEVRALGRTVAALQAAVNQDQVAVKNLAALTRETEALEPLVAQATKAQASTNNCLALLNTLSQQLPQKLIITSINISPDASSTKGAASPSPSTPVLHNKKNLKKKPTVVNLPPSQAPLNTTKKPVTIIIQGTSTTSTSVTRFMQTLGKPGSGVTAPVLTAINRNPRAKKKGTQQMQYTSSGTARCYHFTITGQQEG